MKNIKWLIVLLLILLIVGFLCFTVFAAEIAVDEMPETVVKIVKEMYEHITK